MTLSVSETSVVSPANVPQIHLGTSQIVLRSEDQDSVLDLEEYCSNREVVNLENAAVNIDNSNDVIIGPVTQFNVNGNVTIYTNGTDGQDNENAQEPPAINGTTNGNDTKTSLILYYLHILYLNKNVLRNISILLTVMLICLVITMVISKNIVRKIDDYNYNYTDPYYGDHLGSHNVYYRKDWGGKPPRGVVDHLKHPVKLVIISHSQTVNCNKTERCFELVRTIQKSHTSKPIFGNDVGYNFLIGGDGNIFVARGWDVQNYHRKVSIGISFIGNFNYDTVGENMLQATLELIQQGVRLKKLEEDYVLVGENQTNSKMIVSPGKHVYKVIRTWGHFYNETMF